MRIKKILAAAFCFTSANIFAQAAFDASKWDPPYSLEIPQGWDVERFAIPIEFAPQIPYHGVEDIRFTHGWGDSTSNEYWTYSFLWYLDGKPEINATIIANNLKLYYNGLIGGNIEQRKIPADKIFVPQTSFKEIETGSGDEKTFSGTVHMLDYMQQKPITLNGMIHLKACPSIKDKTFLLYEISPQPLTDNIWQQLDNLNTGFNCSKSK
jgi:hypothetical protein